MSLVIPLLLAALTIPLIIAVLRINELFLLRVRGGKLRVVRGRIPPGLLSDIGDVVRNTKVESADLRAVVEDGRAAIRVRGDGVPSYFRQRLLNTISLWPVAKIRNAPKGH